MTDDIERTILDAMGYQTGIDVSFNTPTVKEFAAGLAAAVRLLREPRLPEGWQAVAWDFGQQANISFDHRSGMFRVWLTCNAFSGSFPTLADAIAAVEKARTG